MTKKVRVTHTNEFKKEAVRLVTEEGYKITEAARNLGIDANLLGRWKKEEEENKNVDYDRKKLVDENRRLQKENKRLVMEREILKKAAAFFARESE